MNRHPIGRFGRRSTALALGLLCLAGSCAPGTESTAEEPAGSSVDDVMRRWQADAQREVARCMRVEGFDYQPYVPSRSIAAQLRGEFEEAEWVELWGYGITADAVAAIAARAHDPNEAILVGLTDSEAQAYLDALYGPYFGGGGEFDPERTPPLEAQGCSGRAVLTAGVENVELFTRASEARAEGLLRLAATPSMVGARADWQRCMRARGFDHRDQAEAQRELADRASRELASLRSELRHLSDVEIAWVLGSAGGSRHDLPLVSQRAFAELLQREVAMARADLDCFDAHVAQVFDPLLARLDSELEQAFGDRLARLGVEPTSR